MCAIFRGILMTSSEGGKVNPSADRSVIAG